MTLTTPELPEGFFFRVTKPTWKRYPLRVELRAKRRIGSRLISHGYANNSHEDVHRAMQRILGNIQAAERYHNTTSTLLGDYPPKILEGQR